MSVNLANDRLILKEVTDDKVRKNFEKIADVTANSDIAKFDWFFIEFNIGAGTFTNYKVAHGLNFTPTDVLVTQVTGSLGFNYDKFDENFLDVNATGPVRFRGLIGRYRENTE